MLYDYLKVRLSGMRCCSRAASIADSIPGPEEGGEYRERKVILISLGDVCKVDPTQSTRVHTTHMLHHHVLHSVTIIVAPSIVEI